MKKTVFAFLMFTITGTYCQQKSFRVEVYGKGDPVILIPGYSCSGDVWKSTVDNLKPNYQLHVLTLAGFAGVAPIETPVLKTIKNDLIKYVKDNHLNKPALIGQGMGAFMSLWLASAEPSLFSKILCVDGVLFTPAISNRPMTEEAAAAYFKNMPQKEFDNQFKPLLSLADTAHAALLARWSAASDRKTLGYAYVEMRTTDLRNEISKITIPVLVLKSAVDTMEPAQKTLSEQYSLLRDKKIIITQAKHFIMYDDPLWFREQVKNFLINGLAD